MSQVIESHREVITSINSQFNPTFRVDSWDWILYIQSLIDEFLMIKTDQIEGDLWVNIL